MNDKKRLFFAAELTAVWPQKFPTGRILDEENRHMTLVFLGLTSPSQLLEKTIPLPAFHIGPASYSTKWIFLPDEKEARVVAAETASVGPLIDYQKKLAEWVNPRQSLA